MKATHSDDATGYTLSEVLLVLGVIATVAALAQPALRSSLGDSRLRSAAPADSHRAGQDPAARHAIGHGAAVSLPGGVQSF